MKKLFTVLSLSLLSSLSYAEISVVNTVQMSAAGTDFDMSGSIGNLITDGVIGIHSNGQAISGAVVIQSTNPLSNVAVVNTVGITGAAGNAISGSVVISQ